MAENEVWIFAEQEDGVLNSVALELTGKARQLADELRTKVGAVLLGYHCEALAKELAAHGADTIYLADHPALRYYRTLPYARVICDLVREHRPQIVIYGATVVGRDLAPRIASELWTGLTADCTDLQIGDYDDPFTSRHHDQILYQIRPAFGGNVIATIVGPNHRPQMATVREGVMKLTPADNHRPFQTIPVTPRITDAEEVVEIIERHRTEREVDLRKAQIIVSGGAGVGSKEGFDLLRELANVLGGAVGASRAAVDAGYISKAHQVGQTGTTVRPRLYIACGISGAVQHRAGMQESSKIIAINTNPDAPILSMAHYAIIGDLNQVIPMMIRAYRGH
ncbi:MAG TPA: electron transfer flavoprotein subunit alpha/FixB family protein [bacterium]|nr:electron transfer flavoprotein subunit alpha/FixB family protein [bacterium]HQL63928.1 electron transfer flavoprotein subunit alpha/FixB family protein [bacterium]